MAAEIEFDVSEGRSGVLIPNLEAVDAATLGNTPPQEIAYRFMDAFWTANTAVGNGTEVTFPGTRTRQSEIVLPPVSGKPLVDLRRITTPAPDDDSNRQTVGNLSVDGGENHLILAPQIDGSMGLREVMNLVKLNGQSAGFSTERNRRFVDQYSIDFPGDERAWTSFIEQKTAQPGIVGFQRAEAEYRKSIRGLLDGVVELLK